MEEEKKIPKPLESILLIIGSIFISFFLIQIGILIFYPNPLENIEEISRSKMLLLFGEFSMILLPFLYLKIKHYSLKDIFRWNPIDNRLILTSIYLGIALSIAGDELDRLIGMFITPPDFLQDLSVIMKINSFQDFIVLVSGVVIIAAIVEESVFRGMLQLSLERYSDVTKAVIYSSLVWTFIHGIIYWAVQIFLIGVVLGYLVWRTKSIVPSIICHAINNALALWQNNSEESKIISIYEWHGHVSPIFLIPAIIFLIIGIKYFVDFYRRDAFSGSDTFNSDSGNSE
jgi:membrane protease YdiL (CAAX protease family)